MTKTRREFLELTAMCAAGCAAARLLGGCSDSGGAPLLANDVVLSLAAYPVLAANGGQVEISSSISGYPFPIFVRNDGGVYTALGGFCDHEACAVNAVGGGFRCPCHGATFSQGGQVTGGPASQAMPAFTTQVAGDTLTILKD
ncbi:MAG: Rieske Fe-S protein [Bradymonadia bacterium]|jgi:Rieske Fe-S protein